MIGLGILTRNRPAYFSQCVESVIDNKRDLDYIVSYNDGSDSKYDMDYDIVRDTHKSEIEFINAVKNKGCSVSKNALLKKMLDRGCDHLFILEDDVLIKSPDVFNRYIESAKKAGFGHLNFALHGSANAGGYQFTDGNVDYYRECVGAFSYFTKEAIDKAGMFDENFHNAWEHCRLTQLMGDFGFTSPFWAFADCHGSNELLKEIPGSIENSSIRHNPEWEKNIKEGLAYWQSIDPNCPIEEYR